METINLYERAALLIAGPLFQLVITRFFSCNLEWIRFRKKINGAASVYVLQNDLILPTKVIMWISRSKSILKLTFGALALRRSESRRETSPLESLFSRHFTLSTQLTKTNYFENITRAHFFQNCTRNHVIVYLHQILIAQIWLNCELRLYVIEMNFVRHSIN